MDAFVEVTRIPGMWAVLAVAAAAGFARGLAGFGIGLIMMPVCAVVIGPKVAIPMMAIMEIPVAFWLAHSVWHDFERREVGILLAATAAGIPLGLAMLLVADTDTVKIGVNVAVLVFAALLLAGFRISGRPSAVRSSLTGLSAGALEGAVGLPGPPIILCWLAAQVPGRKLRANLMVYFLGLILMALPAFWIAGLLTGHVFRVAVLAAPLYLVGAALGKASVGYVAEPLFRKLVLGLVIAGAFSALLA